MYRRNAKSSQAQIVNSMVENLQQYFVNRLNKMTNVKHEQSFERIEWFRDEGRHGGGVRYVAKNEKVFNRASVNVSQIHYDDDSSKNLASATAISTIIHPENPHAPSVHMHISWTEMKNGYGYWRMMADLNPAIANEADKALFDEKIKNVTSKVYEAAAAQGDSYFYIPALGRHRGVSHFYLEEYSSDDFQVDFNLAEILGKTVIDSYIQIFCKAIEENGSPSDNDYKIQLDYHTLYLFQVLTLDRGTTSGLLVHDQNDVGIMGSLPSKINKTLLSSWERKLPTPQDKLLHNLLDVFSSNSICVVDENIKKALANAVRKHYKSNPKALDMQAKGNIVPITVGNHQ
ncbi:MAG: coproporphyrinogen III oxidase [Methylococcales bacterium]|nr:coproporphyrinogen III oxidase [Methylococcales bacterium]